MTSSANSTNFNHRKSRKEIFVSIQKSPVASQYLQKLTNKPQVAISRTLKSSKHLKFPISPKSPFSTSASSIKPQKFQSFTFSISTRLENSLYEKLKGI